MSIFEIVNGKYHNFVTKSLTPSRIFFYYFKQVFWLFLAGAFVATDAAFALVLLLLVAALKADVDDLDPFAFAPSVELIN